VSVELNPALLGGRASIRASIAGAPPSKTAGGPASIEDGRTPVESGPASGPSFADVLKDATDRISAPKSTSGPAAAGAGAAGAGATGAGGAEPLRFSKHALERVQRRGIALDPTTLGRLQDGVGRAAGKGSRDSIVLVDGTAFVVSVGNRTVITAVGSEHMREHVFTNIDSAVLA
jgi:flagellar operon protein